MSARAKLNSIFNRPFLRHFIPIVNKVITFWRHFTWTSTKWNPNTNRFELFEKGRLIHVDISPYWACTTKLLRDTVQRINLGSFKINRGDIVVDIGAGTGTEALIFSEDVGVDGKVFAIEAHPETYLSLRELVEKGRYANIIPFQMAIGNKRGEVFIENQSEHEKNAVSFESDHEESLVTEMMTLDDFVKMNNIQRIDFLKVNIEGAEKYMLEGMKESVQIVKTAAISCHDFLIGDQNLTIMAEVRVFFELNGFKVLHVPSSHPVMNSWLYMVKN
jgi:FkbM family methyltransferase